jgi:hypothetical protein
MAIYAVGLRYRRSKVLTIEAEDARGRSAQSKLSGDPALSDDAAFLSAAHSTRERGHRFRGWSSSGRWWLPLVGVMAAALCLPFIHAVSIGDEGMLLTGAERMLRGDRLYADFFEFLPPGGFILTESWFSIAGISIGSVRMLTILTVVGIACFTYLACWRASKNAALSALLAMGWGVMTQGFWTQVSHNWFTTLFSMVAAWAVLVSVEHAQRYLRWPLIAGAAAGMAAMVTTHRGALVMLAAMTAFLNLRRHRVELITYVLGCGLVPIGLLAYVIWHHALSAAFDDVILFTAVRYSPVASVPFGWGGGNPIFKYLFPVAALLVLFVCARDWRTCLRDRLFRLCTAFALAGFLGCFPRSDITHIAFAAPLSCPLLACCITRLTQGWRTMWWRYRHLVIIVPGVVIGLAIPSVLYFLQISKEALRAEIVRTPRGVMAFLGQPPGLTQLLARIAETPSSDAYFFYPYLSILPFVTSREQVSKYDQFLPGYTLPSQYHEACISVMRHASWVVIDRRLTDPKVLKQLFPGTRDADPPEKKRFEQALDRGFELVAREGTFELRRRRQEVSDAACSGIAE